MDSVLDSVLDSVGSILLARVRRMDNDYERTKPFIRAAKSTIQFFFFPRPVRTPSKHAMSKPSSTPPYLTLPYIFMLPKIGC